MKKKELLEDMVLFPEDAPQVVEFSFSDFDDEPVEVNNMPLNNKFKDVDDDVFEFGYPIDDSGNSNAIPFEDREEKAINRSILSMVMDLITDEQEAIRGYNDFLSSLSFEEKISKEDVEKVSQVIEDIIKEENVHIGQLMEVQKIFNPHGEAIDKGAQEGAEQIAEDTSEKMAAKSLFEEIQKATFVDPKVQKSSDKDETTVNAEEVCTLTDTDDEF